MSIVRGALLALIVCAVAPSMAEAAAKKKRPAYDKGYGFLPGYPPKREQKREWQWRYYGINGRWHYYRGHLTGPTYGPCWKQTPIGPMWICG